MFIDGLLALKKMLKILWSGGNNFLIFREKSAQSSKQESGSLTIEANFQDVGDNLGVSGWREMSETHWLLNVV